MSVQHTAQTLKPKPISASAAASVQRVAMPAIQLTLYLAIGAAEAQAEQRSCWHAIGCCTAGSAANACAQIAGHSGRPGTLQLATTACETC